MRRSPRLEDKRKSCVIWYLIFRQSPNTIMLHNVSDLTDVLTGMAAAGWPLTKELIGRLSPYMREHLRRFGQYMLDMDILPPPLVSKSLGIPS
jgi:hypothetical protein